MFSCNKNHLKENYNIQIQRDLKFNLNHGQVEFIFMIIQTTHRSKWSISNQITNKFQTLKLLKSIYLQFQKLNTTVTQVPVDCMSSKQNRKWITLDWFLLSQEDYFSLLSLAFVYIVLNLEVVKIKKKIKTIIMLRFKTIKIQININEINHIWKIINYVLILNTST
jgi:hypothetical protein